MSKRKYLVASKINIDDLRKTSKELNDSNIPAPEIQSSNNQSLIDDKIKETYTSMNNYFNDPNHYLEQPESCVLGTSNNTGPKMDHKRKIIPHSVVGYAYYKNVRRQATLKQNQKPPIHPTSSLVANAPNHYHTSTLSPFQKNQNQGNWSDNIKNLNSRRGASIFVYNTGNTEALTKDKEKNYIVLSNSKVDDIFNKARTRIMLSDDKEKKTLLNFPKEIRKKLKDQERVLTAFKNQSKVLDDINKTISIKVNRTENESIMAKSEEYKIKKQLINLIEESKKFDGNHGTDGWVASLRRADNFKGRRNILVNKGSAEKPKFFLLSEKSKDEKEVVVTRPLSQSGSMTSCCFGSFLNKSGSGFFKSLADTTHKTSANRLDSIERLKIEGHNLLEHEYRQIKSMHGTKILKKKFLQGPQKNLEGLYDNNPIAKNIQKMLLETDKDGSTHDDEELIYAQDYDNRSFINDYFVRSLK